MEENKDPKEGIPKRPTLADMTAIEVIGHCGRLKYPIDKVISILSSKSPNNIHLEKVRKQIVIPGTEEYIAYHSGMDAGDFEIDNALYSDILEGTKTSVDSQKALTEIQSKRTVSDAIQEKFFPED